ncbi:hypothetical protein niasHS_014157 [Heterodera schachtii]|uniref:Uncharacterized protein n=1 Tax=Heterodera schachtii TaxID=97005 RepID=A0ABD2IRF9_HETSC
MCPYCPIHCAVALRPGGLAPMDSDPDASKIHPMSGVSSSTPNTAQTIWGGIRDGNRDQITAAEHGEENSEDKID